MSDFLRRTADLAAMYPTTTGAARLPQDYCRDVTDHPAHKWDRAWQGWKDGLRVREYATVYQSDRAMQRREIDSASPIEIRCPGRYTPSNYRAPHVSPQTPADPFAGIE